MRTQLLRFDGAVERDPAIDAWMKEHADELGAIAHQWFEVMRKCGDEVRELLHADHSPPTDATQHKPLEQGRTFTRRTPAAIVTLCLRVLSKPALIFVDRPIARPSLFAAHRR